MIKSRARAAARLPLRGGTFNLRWRTRRRELRDRSEASFPKRQRTGAVQKLAPARTGREFAQRFGLCASPLALSDDHEILVTLGVLACGFTGRPARCWSWRRDAAGTSRSEVCPEWRLS